MSKKRKKYISHLNNSKVAKSAVRDLAIGFCANNDHLHLINIKHNRLERAGAAINGALEKIRYKWVIYIAAMGRNELKQAYIKSEEIRVPHEVFKSDINDIVAAHHTELRKSVPVKQLSNVGWLASLSRY